MSVSWTCRRFFGSHSQLKTAKTAVHHIEIIKSDSATLKRIPIADLVNEVSDLLPHQGILENFIHHNPLKHLESIPFNDAIDFMHKLEMYMSPSERLLSLVDVDPRKRVNEALADLSSVFLDRGAAKWAPGFRHKGFLYFFASLEVLGFAPWRKYARSVAQRILELEQINKDAIPSLSETIIQENLEFFDVPRDDWGPAIHAMASELRGWAGMFTRMESHPNEAPPDTTVRLLDFCAVQSILSRSSMEALARQFGWKESEISFGMWLKRAPTLRPASQDTMGHSSAISYLDQNAERREALENDFEHAILHSIGTNKVQ